MRRIYVASSWRNDRQPDIVKLLRAAGHEVYDFRHPAPGNDGFHWSAIDANWKSWDTHSYLSALSHPIADGGFGVDKAAMDWADTFVLVMPCGRSAHLEAGWAVGAGKPTCVLLDPAAPIEPELMVKLASHVCADALDLVEWLTSLGATP